jgi:hypothetical protein
MISFLEGFQPDPTNSDVMVQPGRRRRILHGWMDAGRERERETAIRGGTGNGWNGWGAQQFVLQKIATPCPTSSPSTRKEEEQKIARSEKKKKKKKARRRRRRRSSNKTLKNKSI